MISHMFCFVLVLATFFISIQPSSVEISDGDRMFFVSVGENLTLTCEMTFITSSGRKDINGTVVTTDENIVTHESELHWELPGGKVKENRFETAETLTTTVPNELDSIQYKKRIRIELNDVGKDDEGLYKCYGEVTLAKRVQRNETEGNYKYSRSSSDLYFLHVYGEKEKAFRLSRPGVCVTEGRQAQWVGQYTSGEKVSVVSWEAFSEDGLTSRNVSEIPEMANRSSITIQPDGKQTTFGFGEFTLTLNNVQQSDPTEYKVTAVDSNGIEKSVHLQLLVTTRINKIVEISPLQEIYQAGEEINVTCIMRHVANTRTLYYFHFAKCEVPEECVEKKYPIIISKPQPQLCYSGPYGPPKARPETVRFKNFKVESSGTFFCGSEYFSKDAQRHIHVN